MNGAVPKVGTRLPDRTVGPFTSADLAAYAEISGDTNPLHLDAALAQKIGLGPATLRATVERFNGWKGEGVDRRLGGQS